MPIGEGPPPSTHTSCPQLLVLVPLAWQTQSLLVRCAQVRSAPVTALPPFGQREDQTWIRRFDVSHAACLPDQWGPPRSHGRSLIVGIAGAMHVSHET